MKEAEICLFFNLHYNKLMRSNLQKMKIKYKQTNTTSSQNLTLLITEKITKKTLGPREQRMKCLRCFMKLCKSSCKLDEAWGFKETFRQEDK